MKEYFDADTMRELEDLAIKLYEMKLEENACKLLRSALEEQIATLVPTEEKGQRTVALPNGTKIVVKRGLNYRAEITQIEALSLECPPIKIKKELDEVGYEWFRANEPGIFAKLSECVTVTPAKVSITLK